MLSMISALFRRYRRSVIVIDDTLPSDVYSALLDKNSTLRHRNNAGVDSISENVIDISAFEEVGKIHVSPLYYTFPNIYQSHLIPDAVLRTLNAHWAMELYKVPDVKFYRLKQVFVLSEGLVFTQSGALVAQTKTHHSETDIDTARKNLQKALSETGDIVSHKKAVLCKKRGADNYGHWLVEMLPKAYLAKRELKIEDWPVVVHKTSAALQSIMRQSLDVIGISEDKIIVTDSQPAYFEDLLVVDGLTSHAIYISPPVMECMEFIASKAAFGIHDSLYAVRRPATSRDFENEPEVSEVFQQAGYTEIETASLSFLEQVRAFKSATRVVGPMGAALTNIIFCRPGTEILIFMPATALELFFWHISEGKKLNYHEIRCEETGEQHGALPWDRALRIPTSAIQNILGKLKTLRSIPASSLALSNAAPEFLITQEQLCNSDWSWSQNMDPASNQAVRFAPDGTIIGYSHINEKSWRLNDGVLEILSSSGLCSWRFDDISKSDGKLRLRARFRLEPNANLLLLTVELPDRKAMPSTL
jgi:capsular polysaccharide biosynthesis protein